MEHWELQVARILGTPVTFIEKRYYGNATNPLKVDEETLLTFYDYLRDELYFPFSASYQKHSTTCIKLEPERSLDAYRGIRVECESEGGNNCVPLTELVLNDEEANVSLIFLYQAWMQKYQQ